MFLLLVFATGSRRHTAADSTPPVLCVSCGFTPELCFYLAHKSQRLDQLDLSAAKKK